MQTTTIRRGDEQRVRLTGRLTAHRHEEGLPAVARRMLNQGARRIVLDLQGVSFMDSTCLGELIEVHREATERQAELYLINVPPRVQRLLDVSGLGALLSHRSSG